MGYMGNSGHGGFFNSRFSQHGRAILLAFFVSATATVFAKFQHCNQDSRRQLHTFEIKYSRESSPIPYKMSGNRGTVVGLSWQPEFSFVPSDKKEKSTAKETETTALYRSSSELVDGLFLPPNDPRKLNKLLKKQVKDTAGKNWFDMPAQTITPELKRDLQLLKLRSAMDPKRHYKKGDSKLKTLPKYFQVGTVVESASEFYSGRLTKKERKATIADELLSDSNLKEYRKRKVREVEEANRPAGVGKWNIKKSSKHGKSSAKKRRH